MMYIPVFRFENSNFYQPICEKNVTLKLNE